MTNRKKPYIIVPREIIEMYELDDIRIPIYVFFSCRRGIDDTIGFSFDKLSEYCGYKPNAHKNMINDKCKSILNDFINCNLFDIHPDNLSIFKHSEYVEIKINDEMFCPQTTYACIDIDEIDKIQKFKKFTTYELNKITVSKLLLLLSYIRVNKLTRTQLQNDTHPENKPEIFYKHYKDIGKDLGMNEDTVVKVTDILCNLGIIVTKNIDRYQDNGGNWHTDVTLFVDKREGWEQELIWGEEHLKSGKKRKYNQNNNKQEGENT